MSLLTGVGINNSFSSENTVPAEEIRKNIHPVKTTKTVYR